MEGGREGSRGGRGGRKEGGREEREEGRRGRKGGEGGREEGGRKGGEGGREEREGGRQKNKLLHEWSWYFHEPKGVKVQPTSAITAICTLTNVMKYLLSITTTASCLLTQSTNAQILTNQKHIGVARIQHSCAISWHGNNAIMFCV